MVTMSFLRIRELQLRLCQSEGYYELVKWLHVGNAYQVPAWLLVS